jgi:hypothetical protein
MLVTLVGEKAATAQAQPQQFGDHGQLVITAENLFGFSIERTGQTQANDTESSQVRSGIGLLYRYNGSPRGWVGAHYFVIPNLSVGASLGFQSSGGSSTQTNNGTTVTTDSNPQFTYVILPKVGYALMLNNMLGFWFRGGPGLWHTTVSSATTDASSSANYWFLSVDALFVITPVQYVGFYVGPQGNFSFSGSQSQTNGMGTTVSNDASFRSFSIDAGLFGYFDL